MNTEIDKLKLSKDNRDKEHINKMEREFTLHKHIMEELEFMSKHKITQLSRREFK